MKNLAKLGMLLSLSVAAFLPSLTMAASTADILAALEHSREDTVALIKSKDHAAQLTATKEIAKSSRLVDDAIHNVLIDPATTPDTKTKVTECKTIWEAVKSTRDLEVIPAVLSDHVDKAKSIARKKQADRFKQMQALLK